MTRCSCVFSLPLLFRNSHDVSPLSSLRDLEYHGAFVERHIGPNDVEIAQMLRVVGYDSLESLTDAIVPEKIRSTVALDLPKGITEEEALAKIRVIANKNRVFRSFIGQGYYGTHTPKVILRNILENPAWYTAYTPYQAEISQGRMEALINFQTMCADLTGMEIANASLLDEATAAAEAMSLAKRSAKSRSDLFLCTMRCIRRRWSYCVPVPSRWALCCVWARRRRRCRPMCSEYCCNIQIPSVASVITGSWRMLCMHGVGWLRWPAICWR